MTLSTKKVKEQSKFCLELAKRLNDDVQNSKVYYGRIEYHTRMENDITRLRRELNELDKMLKAWGYDN